MLTVDKRFYVYILFRENGKPFYVGKGSGRRWLNHEKDAKHSDTYKDRIVRSMVTNGHQIRRIKFVEELTESAAFFFESLLIRKIGRYPNGPLANATDGGDGVPNLSLESRKKISDAQRGNQYGKGRKMSPAQQRILTEARKRIGYKKETYDKIAAKLRGVKHSKEHNEKISNGGKGRVFTEEHRKRISISKRRENLSKETLRKRSESLRGRVPTEEARQNMRTSRLHFLEKENAIPEAVEARRRAASLAACARWSSRKVS